MRARLAKAVRDNFARRMQAELPQFVPSRSKPVPPGDSLYLWNFSRSLKFYVFLQLSPKPKQDSFTVELACSSGDFPFSHAALGPTPQKDGSVRFRLPQLYRDEWRPKTGWEPWWWIVPRVEPREMTSKAVARAVAGKRPLTESPVSIEQAFLLVEPQVNDAVDRIKRFGVPFFEQYAKGHRS